MENLKISSQVEAKIRKKHGLERSNVEQCFSNIEGGFLIDTREDHKTDPATQWFVAEDNMGRIIKVVFIFSDEKIYLKSAFVANEDEIYIYNKHAK
jgi:hypothetical protein